MRLLTPSRRAARDSGPVECAKQRLFVVTTEIIVGAVNDYYLLCYCCILVFSFLPACAGGRLAVPDTLIKRPT